MNRFWKTVTFLILAALPAFTFAQQKNASSEVAFLTDVKGAVKLYRADKLVKVSSICTSIFNADKLVLQKDSSGLLIFKDSHVRLEPEQTIVINAKNLKVSAKSPGEQSPGVIRGVFSKADNYSLFHLPADSLKATVPAVVRYNGTLKVTSPGPRTLTLSPKLSWETKEDGSKYLLVLKDVYGTGKNYSYETAGKQLEWEKTGWPKLDHNKVYILSIQALKENSPRVDYFFMTFSKGEEQSIQKDITAISESCDNKQSSDFLKAVTLFRYDCLAESLPLFESLYKQHPENKYLEVFTLSCRKKLLGIN